MDNFGISVTVTLLDGDGMGAYAYWIATDCVEPYEVKQGTK